MEVMMEVPAAMRALVVFVGHFGKLELVNW